MGLVQSGLAIRTLKVRHHLTELCEWDLTRIEKIVAKFHHELVSQSGAFTKEDLDSLLRMDFQAIEQLDQEKAHQITDPNLKFKAWVKAKDEQDAVSSICSSPSAKSEASSASSCSSSSSDSSEEEDDDKEFLAMKSKKAFSRHDLKRAVIKFQARIRGMIDRKEVMKRRKLLEERDKWFFEGKTGRTRLDAIFGVFCESCQCINPYDGRPNVDALQVLISLILLCDGPCIGKLKLIYGLLCDPVESDMKYEEVVVMLILFSRCLANIFDGTVDLFSPGNDFELENVASRAMQGETSFTFSRFYSWTLTSKQASPWLGRVCNDVDVLHRVYQGVRCNIAICLALDKTLFVFQQHQQPQEENDQSKSIAVYRYPSHQQLQVIPRHMLRNELGFVIDRHTILNDDDDFTLYLFEGDSTIPKQKRDGKLLFLGKPIIDFEDIDLQVTAGISCIYKYDVLRPDKYRWMQKDYVGVFNAACPIGCDGAFFKQPIHRALYERKEIPLHQFPENNHRLVCFAMDDSFEYVDFRSEPVVFLHKRRKDKYALEEGDEMVVKIDVQRKQVCPHEGESAQYCDCTYIVGKYMNLSQGKLKLQFEYVDSPEHEEEEHHDDTYTDLELHSANEQKLDEVSVDFSFVLVVDDNLSFPLYRDIEFNELPDHGDQILLFRKGKPHMHRANVYHSDWLELRYVQHGDVKQDRMMVCIGTSSQFKLTRCPFNLRRMHGGSVEDYMICDFDQVNPQYLELVKLGDPSVEGDFISLYPVTHPHSLVPFSELKVQVTPALLENEKSQIVFDPYYLKVTKGGKFEARFIQPKMGRIASVSIPAILTPVTMIRDSYGDTGFEVNRVSGLQQQQKIVCQFEIVDPSVWTVWDRLELCRNESWVIAWCYVTAYRRLTGKASLPIPDEMNEGEYFWRYVGEMPETHCKSKTFQVTVKTEEDPYADLEEKERERKVEEDRHREERERLDKAATHMQCLFRIIWARNERKRRVAAQVNEKQDLENEYRLVTSEYNIISKANARRNPALVSRKDRAKESKLKGRLTEIDLRLAFLRTKVSPEFMELERERVFKLQEHSRLSRLAQEAEAVRVAEQRRRMHIRNRLSVRKDPFNQPQGIRRKLDKTSTNATAELADWVKETSGMFEDNEFPAESESIFCGCDNFPCESCGTATAGPPIGCGWMKDVLLGQGAVTWVRLPKILGFKGTLAIFPEQISMRKIGVFQRLGVEPELAARLEPFHMALSACVEHGPVWMSQLIDINHGEFGLYAVKLFQDGEWRIVNIDDRIPCIRDDGVYYPLFTSCDVSLVGGWIYLIEKAFAKMHGSYEVAFGQGRLFQEWMNLFVGGFVATYHNQIDERQLDPHQETFLDDHYCFNIPRLEEGIITVRPSQHGNCIVDQQVCQDKLKAALENRISKFAASTFVSAYSSAPMHGLTVLVLGMHAVTITIKQLIKPPEEDRKKDGQGEEIDLQTKSTTFTKKTKKKNNKERTADGRRPRGREIKASSSPTPQSKGSPKLRGRPPENRKRSPMRRLKSPKDHGTSSSVKNNEKKSAIQREEEKTAVIDEADNEDRLLEPREEIVEIKNVVLVKLRKLLHAEDEMDGRNWRWMGEWNDECELWTDEVKEQLHGEFDPIDDGCFWMKFEDFIKHFDSWGFCMDFRLDRDFMVHRVNMLWEPSGGVRAPYSDCNPIIEFERHGSVEEVFIQIETDGLDADLGEVRLLQLNQSEASTNPPSVLLTQGVRLQGMQIELIPDDSQFQITGQLWLPGLECRCRLLIFAMGTRRPLKCKLLETGKVDPPQPIDFLRDVLSNCQVCHASLGDERGTLKQLRGGFSWCHVNCDHCSLCKKQPQEALVVDLNKKVLVPVCSLCWKVGFGKPCEECERAGPPSLMPVPTEEEDDAEEDGTAQFTIETLDELLCDFTPPSSLVGLDGKCDSCVIRQQIEAAPKCALCHVAILAEVVTQPHHKSKEPVPVHPFCSQKYLEFHSPKCAYCDGPLCVVPEKYSGEIKKARIGVVHEECYRAALLVKPNRKQVK